MLTILPTPSRPYAWKLVLQFNFGDKSNASFYAGLLISAFALAESITGMYGPHVSFVPPGETISLTIA